MSMKIISVVSAIFFMKATTSSLRAVSKSREDEDKCAGQDRFDVIMCKSHMCTDCILQWCTETCQAWQLEFPGCRCSDWPESRTSFSTGDFAGKGGFGYEGAYGQQ